MRNFAGLIAIAFIASVCFFFLSYNISDMVAKSIGDDINYKQLLILPFDN